ncbi:DUF1294 domain-containing protein [Aporhodopirellula aestuarii]|uniref:DUF1294 domain-containing protein n=1 Tax=Aporhodopirellula aestuarii TaxID=2950107 RepID=A0ABT0U0S0_9BACT|nr:DUF1294 domain-containing protein [Aporhodopirellula aestuarii]MCM2370445.1 DUF1294 domain-containing protein [Aporhodopirellula aestuarii]
MTYLPIIAAEMILASAVAIVLYWWDKRAAKRNGRDDSDRSAGTVHSRVPERTLLLASLLGGWPGAWWASQKFRHKTQKRSFRIQFWMAVVLNIMTVAAVLWFTR